MRKLNNGKQNEKKVLFLYLENCNQRDLSSGLISSLNGKQVRFNFNTFPPFSFLIKVGGTAVPGNQTEAELSEKQLLDNMKIKRKQK